MLPRLYVARQSVSFICRGSSAVLNINTQALVSFQDAKVQYHYGRFNFQPILLVMLPYLKGYPE